MLFIVAQVALLRRDFRPDPVSLQVLVNIVFSSLIDVSSALFDGACPPPTSRRRLRRCSSAARFSPSASPSRSRQRHPRRGRGHRPRHQRRHTEALRLVQGRLRHLARRHRPRALASAVGARRGRRRGHRGLRCHRGAHRERAEPPPAPSRPHRAPHALGRGRAPRRRCNSCAGGGEPHAALYATTRALRAAGALVTRGTGLAAFRSAVPVCEKATSARLQTRKSGTSAHGTKRRHASGTAPAIGMAPSPTSKGPGTQTGAYARDGSRAPEKCRGPAVRPSIAVWVRAGRRR